MRNLQAGVEATFWAVSPIQSDSTALQLTTESSHIHTGAFWVATVAERVVNQGALVVKCGNLD